VKHKSTRLIFEYWNRLRGNRPAPSRSEIDPAAIRHALSDTFMLGADFIDGIRFRLAGTRMCALFGREIKGEPFNAFWNETSRAQIADIGSAALNEAVGAVAGVTGRTAKGAELNWNCCCCQLPTTDARAFALLARSRRWRRLIGLAKTQS